MSRDWPRFWACPHGGIWGKNRTESHCSGGAERPEPATRSEPRVPTATPWLPVGARLPPRFLAPCSSHAWDAKHFPPQGLCTCSRSLPWGSLPQFTRSSLLRPAYCDTPSSLSSPSYPGLSFFTHLFHCPAHVYCLRSPLVF